MAVLLEGAAAGLDSRVEAARRLLAPATGPASAGAGAGVRVGAAAPPWWAAPPWENGGAGLRLTAALSREPALLDEAAAVAGRHRVPLTVRGSAGVGVFMAGLPEHVPARSVAAVVDGLRRAATAAGGHAVVLVAPPRVRDLVDSWGPVPGLALMRRVKQRFDPGARFAPGRFVGGI